MQLKEGWICRHTNLGCVCDRKCQTVGLWGVLLEYLKGVECSESIKLKTWS